LVARLYGGFHHPCWEKAHRAIIEVEDHRCRPEAVISREFGKPDTPKSPSPSKPFF
jgi:hypothetical protein